MGRCCPAGGDERGGRGPMSGSRPGLSSRPSEGTLPANPLILDFWPRNVGENELFEAPQLAGFCWGCPGVQYY